MKFLICLTITFFLTAPLQAQTPAETEAELQARIELNEAARAYRAGNFAEAQAHSERAMQLDPQNKTAAYFVARTIHAQYKPGDNAAENVARAREAITAYQKIIELVPADDEAYKAVAFLYAELKEEELLREWIHQRAGNVFFTKDKRAEAFIILAARDWDCSFKITELPTHKVTTVEGNKTIIRFQMPKEQAKFERAKECANRGLEMVNMAIMLTPESEQAWDYKAHILVELEKLAEMSGEPQRQRKIHQQHEEAVKEKTRLSKRPPSNP